MPVQNIPQTLEAIYSTKMAEKYLQTNIIASEVDEILGFLCHDHGFIKIPEYQYVREIHNDFIKENVIIKVVYEGSIILEILKSTEPESDLINAVKRTCDYDPNHFKRKYFSMSEKDETTSKQLQECAQLIKNKPKILKGIL